MTNILSSIPELPLEERIKNLTNHASPRHVGEILVSEIIEGEVVSDKES